MSVGGKPGSDDDVMYQAKDSPGRQSERERK